MKCIFTAMLIFLLFGCGNKNKSSREYFNDETINGNELKGLGNYIIGVTTLNDIKKEGYPVYLNSEIFREDTNDSYRYEYYKGCMDLDTVIGVDKSDFYQNKHRLYEDTLICQLVRKEYWVGNNMLCDNVTLDFYKDTLVAIGFTNFYNNRESKNRMDILEVYISKYGQGKGYHETNELYMDEEEKRKYKENISEFNWENTSLTMKLLRKMTYYEKSGNMIVNETVQIKDKNRFPLFRDRLKKTYDEAIRKIKQEETDRMKKIMDGI